MQLLRPIFWGYFLLVFFSSPVLAQVSQSRVFTSDIDHFWQAFDSVRATPDLESQVKWMQTLYVDRGTAGLKAFMKLRNFDAERLVIVINAYPEFWKSIRPNTYLVHQKKDAINTYLQRFRELYRGHRNASIYFTITAIRSAGSAVDTFALIGTEIASGDRHTVVSEFPDKRLENFFATQKTNNIVPFTIHEYVHTQQKGDGEILLGQALSEGVCDFITEMVMDTVLPFPYLVYGKAHERELKNRFRKELYSENFSNWLYNGRTTDTVADLGYFMGYAICRDYYRQAADKPTAIAEMIELDYTDRAALGEFLRRSGYYLE